MISFRMRKLFAILVSVFLIFSICGCSKEVTIKETYDNGFRTYYEMSDNTWQCDELSYKYRLEISGRMPNAAKDSTFVYLSNIKSISFEQAWRAAGLSSSSDDYFSPEDAVLVEMR